MTSQKQLFAVFNFYETITPPPNYPTFTAGWKTLGSYVETLDHYVAAQLHRNLDEQGECDVSINDHINRPYTLRSQRLPHFVKLEFFADDARGL